MPPAALAVAHTDPFRPPNWRFLRVRRLLDAAGGARPCSRADDPWVRRYKAFLAAWERAGDATAQDDAAAASPDCYHAYQLADAAADDVRRQLPAVVEARLLAGQTPAEVAALCGTTPAAIECYEAVHFHVRDRLDRPDWVVTQVIQPALYAQIDAARTRRAPECALSVLDGTLRLFGYFCGPKMVDFLSRGVDARRAVSADELDTWLDEQWKRTVRRRSLQAAHMAEINRFNAADLFAVHARVIDLEQSPGAARKAKGEVDRALTAFLSGVPTVQAAAAGTDPRPGRLAAVADTAADPTGAEWLALGRGEDPAAVAELTEARFPDPTPTPEPAEAAR